MRASRHTLRRHATTHDRPKPDPLTCPFIAYRRDGNDVGSFGRGLRGAGPLPVRGGRLFRHDFRDAVRDFCLLRRYGLRRYRGRSR
ncbi:MAG TPA: hypothetical protein VF025_13145 [Gaiellaceae bacterium]